MKQLHSDAFLINELRRVYELCGNIRKSDFNKYSKVYSKTLVRRFGSWGNAQKLANVKAERTKENKKVFSDDYILNALKEAYKIYGQELTKRKFEKVSNLCAATVMRRFESWQKALELVDIKTRHIRCNSSLNPVDFNETELAYLESIDIGISKIKVDFPLNTKLDLQGKVDNITIIYPVTTNSKGVLRWLCKCNCGNLFVASSELLTRKRNPTRSCGCLIKRQGKDCPRWDGYEGISGNWWNAHVRARNNIKVNLTKKEAWDLYLKQNKCCVLTGLPIKIAETSNSTENVASLDRIDSSGHYEIGNVHWVHKDVNFMKQCYSLGYFINMCCLVTKKFIEESG